jgi:hypothetical protein
MADAHDVKGAFGFCGLTPSCGDDSEKHRSGRGDRDHAGGCVRLDLRRVEQLVPVLGQDPGVLRLERRTGLSHEAHRGALGPQVLHQQETNQQSECLIT